MKGNRSKRRCEARDRLEMTYDEAKTALENYRRDLAMIHSPQAGIVTHLIWQVQKCYRKAILESAQQGVSAVAQKG